MQGGEGIVGDLRLGGGDGGQQGRLAGVGQADEADVGDQLQAQPDPQLLAGPAGFGVARRAVGGGFELGVAAAAVAALGEHGLLARVGQVGEHRLLVLGQDLGADGDLDDQGLAGGAAAVLAHAVVAAFGAGNAAGSGNR